MVVGQRGARAGHRDSHAAGHHLGEPLERVAHLTDAGHPTGTRPRMDLQASSTARCDRSGGRGRRPTVARRGASSRAGQGAPRGGGDHRARAARPHLTSPGACMDRIAPTRPLPSAPSSAAGGAHAAGRALRPAARRRACRREGGDRQIDSNCPGRHHAQRAAFPHLPAGRVEVRM